MSDAKPKKKTSTKSKYKFHSDYLTEVVEEGRPKHGTRLEAVNKIKHDHLDDDEYWAEKYSIKNWRGTNPKAYNHAEFENFYEWLAGGEGGGQQMEKLLFTGHTLGQWSSPESEALGKSTDKRRKSRASSSHGQTTSKGEDRKEKKKSINNRLSRSASDVKVRKH